MWATRSLSMGNMCSYGTIHEPAGRKPQAQPATVLLDFAVESMVEKVRLTPQLSPLRVGDGNIAHYSLVGCMEYV